MTDAVILPPLTDRGNFDPAAVYNPNDLILYNGVPYYARIGTIAGVTFTPGSDPNTWQLITLPGDPGDKGDKGAPGDQGVIGRTGLTGPSGAGYRLRGAWDAGTAYLAEDTVSYKPVDDLTGAGIWFALLDNTDVAPGSDATVWAAGIKGDKGDIGDVTPEATAAAAAALASQDAAAASATAADGSATDSAASATTAGGHADDAATSATASAGSATAAAGSAASLSASLASFNKFYLGEHTTDPTLDNQGNPLTEGATYFNTTPGAERVRVYLSGAWADQSQDAETATANAQLAATQAAGSASNAASSASTASGSADDSLDSKNDASASAAAANVSETNAAASEAAAAATLAAALVKTNNLSDVPDKAAARANLAVGKTLLSTQNIANAASVTITGMDAGYSEYEIVISDLTAEVSGDAPTMQVSSDGGATFDTSASYSWAHQYHNQLDSALHVGGLAGQHFFGFVLGCATNLPINYKLNFFNPDNPNAQPWMIRGAGFGNDDNVYNYSAAACYVAGVPFNAVQFAMGSGFKSGTFSLYGINK